MNFGESFAGLKNGQPRPSLQDSTNLAHKISSSFRQQSKSFNQMQLKSLNRKVTKEDSEGRSPTTDREQPLQTDRTDERRSNPGSPMRPLIAISLRNG